MKLLKDTNNKKHMPDCLWQFIGYRLPIVYRFSIALLLLLLTACSNRIEPSQEVNSEIVETQAYLDHVQRITNTFNNHAYQPGQILKSNWQEMPLSAGDRVRIIVNEGEHFSGKFEVSVDGYLHIPFIKPVKASGISTQQVEINLQQQLISEGMFKPGLARVSVDILRWAEIPVNVSGAVFSPGRQFLYERDITDKMHEETQTSGHNPFNRFLTSALKGAGGIRPDADLSQITLIRDEKQAVFDVSGIFTGKPVKDIPLQSHDRIIVPSLGFEQTNLIRPSQITPPGFQVFLSNLTIPASSNAQSAASANARTMQYGTRLLQGLMAANCVGGARATNAYRSAVLVSKDYMTSELTVIERPIETLVQHANREEYNPYLMPGDGIACYDSTVTNIREIAHTISEVLEPVNVLKLMFF
ncbi:MAG: polysaccharide biosynthesis/export family protein [Methylococcales bacterium]